MALRRKIEVCDCDVEVDAVRMLKRGERTGVVLLVDLRAQITYTVGC